MDHAEAPALDALAEYHRRGHTPPYRATSSGAGRIHLLLPHGRTWLQPRRRAGFVPSRSPRIRPAFPCCSPVNASAGALDYLHSRVEAGMVLPDPADPELQTIRVVV